MHKRCTPKPKSPLRPRATCTYLVRPASCVLACPPPRLSSNQNSFRMHHIFTWVSSDFCWEEKSIAQVAQRNCQRNCVKINNNYCFSMEHWVQYPDQILPPTQWATKMCTLHTAHCWQCKFDASLPREGKSLSRFPATGNIFSHVGSWQIKVCSTGVMLEGSQQGFDDWSMPWKRLKKIIVQLKKILTNNPKRGNKFRMSAWIF